jgi:hypothetical protein
VKKWRKRLAEDDPHDPSVWCSRWGAHPAPSLRWDVCVIKRMVEMRFSPPENADRGCLGLVLCSPLFPVMRSCKRHKSLCPAPVDRNGAILHATGCLLTRSKESPHPNELREPLEEIQMDFKDGGSLSPEQSPQGKRKPGDRGRSCCRCSNLDRPIGPGARGFPRTNRMGNGDHFLAPLWTSAPDDL